MAAAPVEGMARAIAAVALVRVHPEQRQVIVDRDWRRWEEEARAAWAFALAAMREPIPAYDAVARENNADLNTGDEIMGAMLDAFARAHGLDEPPGKG